MDHCRPHITLMGYAGSGKTTLGRFMAELGQMNYCDISDILIPAYEQAMNTVIEDKTEHRPLLYAFGRGVETVDPLWFIRRCLQHHEIVGGLRAKCELDVAKEENLFDLYVWVEKKGDPPSTDLEVGPKDADIVVTAAKGDIGSLRVHARGLIREARERWANTYWVE